MCSRRCEMCWGKGVLHDTNKKKDVPCFECSGTGKEAHNTRCLLCGRTWWNDGVRRVGETIRCLQCGATRNDWERAPDGIDFRSQHTEKGKPKT